MAVEPIKPAQIYLNRTGGAIIPVNIPGVPDRLEFGGKQFFRKVEFHVTAFYAKGIIPILADQTRTSEEEAHDLIWGVLERHASKASIEGVTFTGGFRLAAHSGEQSIVAMCRVEGLDKFYKAINAELPVVIDYPPTHVTLYTDEHGSRGVPLLGEPHLKTRTKAIADAPLAELRQALGHPEIFGDA